MNIKCASIDSIIIEKILTSNLRGVPKSLEKYTKMEIHFLFCPLFLRGNHWALLVFDLKLRQLRLYDSIYSIDKNIVYKLSSTIGKYVSKLNRAEFWNIVDDLPYPKQIGNITDCEVFICSYAKHIALDLCFDFSQDDIPNIRKTMASEIMKYEIIAKFKNKD